jgi:hypothetical protein
LKLLQGEAELAGLNINVKKTKDMIINVTTTTEKLSIGGKEIEQVDSFTYLGSIVTSDGGSEESIRVQIRKENGAFIQLCHIWKSKIISKKTEIFIFNSIQFNYLLFMC